MIATLGVIKNIWSIYKKWARLWDLISRIIYIIFRNELRFVQIEHKGL